MSNKGEEDRFGYIARRVDPQSGRHYYVGRKHVDNSSITEWIKIDLEELRKQVSSYEAYLSTKFPVGDWDAGRLKARIHGIAHVLRKSKVPSPKMPAVVRRVDSLLKWLPKSTYRDAFMGDLHEEAVKMLQSKSHAKVSCYYVFQTGCYLGQQFLSFIPKFDWYF